MLTGLPNRTLFFDRVRQAMARTRRAGKPMALFFLDIDRFKQINDTFGHAAGDDVLRVFAQRLRGCVRETDTVARLAGDEFTMILEGLGGAHDAETVARKVLESVRPPVALADREVTIASSIGIVLYAREDGREMTADALLELADKALYSAKSGGRNRYVFHHDLGSR
jgi:diguanylate cyclase (GGDEF)-like protein